MGQLRSGVHQQLEDEAWAIIAESLKGVTSQEAKKDILTPWKEKDRLSREVYNANGAPDASLRKGMYIRAYNPSKPGLNSIDCPARIRHKFSNQDGE